VEAPLSIAVTEPALLLSAEKVAELLDISVRTLSRLRAGRQIPSPIRVGGSVRWRIKDLETWIAKGCPACRN
jgi:prophage regulatory protein